MSLNTIPITYCPPGPETAHFDTHAFGSSRQHIRAAYNGYRARELEEGCKAALLEALLRDWDKHPPTGWNRRTRHRRVKGYGGIRLPRDGEEL